MARRKYLGLAEVVQPITYGEPGKRTFNVTAESERGSGTVWLEKEQLYSIAESLGSALILIDAAPAPSDDAGEFDESDEGEPGSHIEFKAWQIALQYDERRRVFVFAAAGPDPDVPERERGDDPDALMLHFAFSHEQASELAAKGMEIVAAGRPICPYCSNAIDQGESHLCHRRNGHSIEASGSILDAIDELEE